MKSPARRCNQRLMQTRPASAGGGQSGLQPAQIKRASSPRRVDPAAVGRKVLEGLAKGRARLAFLNKQRKAESAQRAVQIAYLSLADQQAGRPAHGRAGRISRKLRGHITERLVRKYLARLSSGADLGVYDRENFTGGHHG